VARRNALISRLAPAALLLLAIAGCSGANLGDIDEEVNSREQMPGPGILADDEGESALKWSNDSEQAETETSGPVTATATPVNSDAATLSPQQAEFEHYKAWIEFKGGGAQSEAAGLSPQQVEFEHYKTWKQLSSEGAESMEYREFQEWLEFREFKATQ
jgi:hypothetical protein